MRPMFSIVMPVYNLVGDVADAVESVLRQTFFDYELIVVDDGSTDGCAELLDELASEKVKVIHQRNQGVVAARENGFLLSVGKWVLFVDGDDVIEENTLDVIAKTVQCENPDMVQFGYKCVDRNGVIKMVKPDKTGLFFVKDILDAMKRNPLEVVGMCIGDKCYRREIADAAFRDVGDVKIAHSEDGLFALAALYHAKRISFIQDCLYEYRYRENSASHKLNLDIVWIKEAFIKRIGELSDHCAFLDQKKKKRIFDSLSREALGHIFRACLDRRCSTAMVRRLAKELRESCFFQKERSDWNPVSHYAMRALVYMPVALCLARPLVGLLAKVKLAIKSK